MARVLAVARQGACLGDNANLLSFVEQCRKEDQLVSEDDDLPRARGLHKSMGDAAAPAVIERRDRIVEDDR